MLTYGPTEERRALSRLLRDLCDADPRPGLDCIDAAEIAGMGPHQLRAAVERQRRARAPHGLCPECGEPLYLEPRSVEPVTFWGAWGAEILPASLGCAECGEIRERGAA